MYRPAILFAALFMAFPAAAQTNTRFTAADHTAIHAACQQDLDRLRARSGQYVADTWRKSFDNDITHIDTHPNDTAKIRYIQERIRHDQAELDAGYVDRLKVGYRQCGQRAILARIQARNGNANAPAPTSAPAHSPVTAPRAPAPPPPPSAARPAGLGTCVELTIQNKESWLRNKCDININVYICMMNAPVESMARFGACQNVRLIRYVVGARGMTPIPYPADSDIELAWYICELPATVVDVRYNGDTDRPLSARCQ